MALERARSRSFVHRKSDKANPAQKYPVPQTVIDDPNWIEVTDVKDFRKLFSSKEWKIIPEFKEYAVYIHKSHSIFSVLDEYKNIAKDIVSRLTPTEQLTIIKEALGGNIAALEKLSHYQLVAVCDDFGIEVDIDKNNNVSILARPEIKVLAPKVDIKKTPSIDVKSDFTKKDLAKLDLYQLNDLCTTKGIDTKGTTKKDGLINLLLGGK